MAGSLKHADFHNGNSEKLSDYAASSTIKLASSSM